MRVLLDESMDRHFASALVGHEVRTVRQMGWMGLANGTLLHQAFAAGFDALVTADRGIEYQQDISRTGLGIVVLIARSNRLDDHRPLAPQVLDALSTIEPGQVVHVGASRRSYPASESS